MAIETLTITESDDTVIMDIARQRHMNEGVSEEQVAAALRTAVASGQSVTALRDMNTNTFRRLTVEGQNVIN